MVQKSSGNAPVIHVYPIIYQGLATSQVVIAGFVSHQQYHKVVWMLMVYIKRLTFVTKQIPSLQWCSFVHSCPLFWGFWDTSMVFCGFLLKVSCNPPVVKWDITNPKSNYPTLPKKQLKNCDKILPPKKMFFPATNPCSLEFLCHHGFICWFMSKQKFFIVSVYYHPERTLPFLQWWQRRLLWYICTYQGSQDDNENQYPQWKGPRIRIRHVSNKKHHRIV